LFFAESPNDDDDDAATAPVPLLLLLVVIVLLALDKSINCCFCFCFRCFFSSTNANANAAPAGYKLTSSNGNIIRRRAVAVHQQHRAIAALVLLYTALFRFGLVGSSLIFLIPCSSWRSLESSTLTPTKKNKKRPDTLATRREQPTERTVADALVFGPYRQQSSSSPMEKKNLSWLSALLAAALDLQRL